MTDTFRRPEDSEYEVKCMSPGVGALDVYPSIWGHWAGGPPGNMEDVKWLDEKLAKIFNDTPVGGNDVEAGRSKLEQISIG